MTEQDQREFRADGFSAERRANFEAADAAVRAWEKVHPWSLEQYLDFLQSLQELFGPFPVSHRPWPGDDFRL